MTNTTLLRNRIAESGLKLSFIAQSLGINAYTLKLKIDNFHEFKASEIQTLCSLLKIDNLEEKQAIFFACEVDGKSTL